MRQDAEFFGDQELVLIYTARRLKEAFAAEKALDAAALDYTVVPTRYTSGVLFRSEKIGAFFYITPQSAERARALLLEVGLKPFEEAQGRSLPAGRMP